MTIVVVVSIYIIMVFNTLVSSRNKVEEAFSTMDVFLKKRFDLVPALNKTVKSYADHESQTLEHVAGQRAKASSRSEQFNSEAALTLAIEHIMVTVENYPNLKANDNFLHLQEELHKIEEDIAHSRRYYNGAVRQYNNETMMFPSNLVAGLFNFKRKPMFEVSNYERNTAHIKL